jgi:hypothetical protein
MDEERCAKLEKLEAELESAERVLRDFLEWLSDDRNLTDKGIAAREVLRRDLEAIERDAEAVRQEHGWPRRPRP